jgi:hypothetical protein
VDTIACAAPFAVFQLHTNDKTTSMASQVEDQQRELTIEQQYRELIRLRREVQALTATKPQQKKRPH